MNILYLPNSHCQQRQFEKPNFMAYPVRLAMEAEFYRGQGNFVQWDYPFPIGINRGDWDKIIITPENLSFLSLPHPDRIFTKAFDKKYQQNGNFKYHPGTYIQSASGCWWGKCSFCVEKGLPYEVRPVDDVINEITVCKKLGFREIFDDSATFPQGEWLNDFTKKLAKLNMHFSCNMRINNNIDYHSLRNAGFRMLLYGIESANQETLDKINKGVKSEDIIPTIKRATKAGLQPHIAVMFGYPWENDKQALETLKLTHYLLRKGYAKTAQASLYKPCGGKNNPQHKRFVHRIYDCAYYPDFWFNQIKDIKNKDDLKYLWRKIKAALND